MVTFIPPYCGEAIKSSAEKKMFNILQKLDLKHAYVIHSLGLPKHQTKVYGEIDFVVVCERGVACLEIKGGRVECRDGRWYFKDRYGVERRKPEGPFAQVIGNMFSLKTLLKNKFQKNPNIRNLLVASGVVFPDIMFQSEAEEIIPEMIFDKKSSDITRYLEEVFDYWQGRQHNRPFKLSLSDIQDIVAYLWGNFVFVPALNDRLSEVEERLVRLTFEQFRTMDALSVNERLLIEGNAGTGKTLLAVNFAKSQAEKGNRVLYLAFNKNLTHDVQRQIGGVRNLKVINIHALFGEYVEVDIDTLNANPQKYFSEDLPNAFYEYIDALEQQELEEMQYDLLVMDEGQDILVPEYLYALDHLFLGGFEKGRWTVFYDEKQNIYNPKYKEGFDILNSLEPTRFKLFVNCRNTVQIGNYSSKVSGVELNEFIRENGEEVQKVVYSDKKDFAKKVKEIIRGLEEEKVNLKDVVFLAPKQYEKSMLKEVDLEIKKLNDEFDLDKDVPIYATIQGFKGLDSKIVILFDVDNIKDEKFSQLMYIASTRARTLLYIIGSEEFWKRQEA